MRTGIEKPVVTETASAESAPMEIIQEEEEKKELSFGELWTNLKEEGWTYKKGTGLVAWLYCKPGVDIKTAKKDVEYFETEAAVLASIYGKPIVEEPQKRKRSTKNLVLDDADEDSEGTSKKKARQQKGPKKPPTAYALFQKVRIYIGTFGTFCRCMMHLRDRD